VALSWRTLEEFPDLFRSLERVATPVSAQEKLRAALDLFSDASAAGAFIEQAVDLYRRHDEVIPQQVRDAIRELARDGISTNSIPTRAIGDDGRYSSTAAKTLLTASNSIPLIFP